MSKAKRILNFDSILLSSVPVCVEGKHYTLREVSTDIMTKYRTAIFQRSQPKTRLKRRRASQQFRLEGLADLDLFLLSLCLTNDETNQLVEESELRSWPTRITEPLINELKEMSGLQEPDQDEEDEEDYQESVKNSPAAGAPGSA